MTPYFEDLRWRVVRAVTIAAPLASLAAGSLSDLYGPRAIFALMAVMVAVALTLLPLTRASATPSGR
jgi:MFS family permease